MQRLARIFFLHELVQYDEVPFFENLHNYAVGASLAVASGVSQTTQSGLLLVIPITSERGSMSRPEEAVDCCICV